MTDGGIATRIEQFESWMTNSGFTLVEKSAEPELFGDRRWRWTRDDIRVQLSADRGRWFLDVIPPRRDDWFGYGLEIVVDTLDRLDGRHFTTLLPVDVAIQLLQERLGEICMLVSTQAGCQSIELMRHQRARRWFGA